MDFKKIAIIGNGALGGLLTRYFSDHIDVITIDKGESYDSVSACDVVIFAVPIQAYEQVFVAVRPHLDEGMLLVDVCSVKLTSQAMFEESFPDHPNLLIAHPMFGPESAKDTMRGKQLVVCHERGTAGAFVDWFANLYGPTVVRMSAEEHDKIMAEMHALTFFVARGLTEYGLKPHPLQANSYSWLLGLQELDAHHSDALIDTIERHNPYAEAARKEFLKKLAKLDHELSS